MAQTPGRANFERQEIGIILFFVLLLSALMFLLGILIGYGLGPDGGTHTSHFELGEATQKIVDTHAENPKVQEKTPPKPNGRVPAVAAQSSGSEMGAKLKELYRKDKQQILSDLTFKAKNTSVPRSVADMEAYMSTRTLENRSPAMVKEKPKDEDEIEREEIRKLEEARERKGVPKGVATLFENKREIASDFRPRSGTYTVQVASYPTLEESKARVKALRAAGYNEAYYDVKKVKNGELWYRVGVGSFPSSSWARKTGTKLVKQALASDYIVRVAE